ncbi:MAG: hypothetical protein JWP13_408 [Candidatus Saccharibacteria bacterium]|nr:hypothetical protein [Candidatus Saccharibacteria bacterium]
MYTPGQHAPKYFDMQDMENRGFQSYWIGRAMQVAEQQKNALAERLGAGALVFSLEYQAQLESDMQRIDSTIQDYAKIIDPSLEK